MNGKKARELRKKAFNLYSTATPAMKAKYTEKQMYKYLKKELKKS